MRSSCTSAAQRKLQGEVSLSEAIETATRRAAPCTCMDVVGVDDTMLEDLEDQERPASSSDGWWTDALTAREADVIRLRYGLDGAPAPDPAAGGRRLRHQPQLCIAH